jgi:phenylalanyl-tRNA synthetase beta chain
VGGEEKLLKMTVGASTASVRPYVVCAVLRGVTFTAEAYKSFIELQEKLHFNICRRRTLVAIGTHDLDTLSGPFRYDAEEPSAIEFVPLSQSRSFRADHLMDFYRTDASVRHLKPYVDILDGHARYPVIRDAKGVVLSLPPIINGDHSRISVATKNVFIECTATDLTKAHIVLNTMLSAFAEYCAEPFVVEPVLVEYERPGSAPQAGGGGGGGGDSDARFVPVSVPRYVTPQVAPREVRVTLAEINTLAGIEIDAPRAADFATRMMLDARVDATTAEPAIVCSVPVHRADVLHACDVVEDVAIAFGYNNIERRLPETSTSGRQQPINQLTDLLRHELAYAGYSECLTMALCERADLYGRLRRADDGRAVVLGNPKTKDFEVARTTLLPGLLKSLASNVSESFKAGVRLFEISDVMHLDSSTDTGARNERKLAALFSGTSAGFEVIHGLVNHIFKLLEVPLQMSGARVPPGRDGLRYAVRPHDDPAFFPKRCAAIVLLREDGSELALGTFGILHPEVLSAFALGEYPASAVEFTLRPFVRDMLEDRT